MTDLPASITVSNLRDECHFASTIADRGWSAWWTESDVTLTDYLRGIQFMGEGEGIPCAFVAHAGQQYAGSVLLIADDLESRPTYTPWIAALWVEPAYRRQGVAARLLGPVGAVAFGGIGAMVVTAAWARMFPTLRDADTLA